MAARSSGTGPARKRAGGPPRGNAKAPSRGSAPVPAPAVVLPALRADARTAIETTVTGLGYEVVDIERAPRGLLRITIDRIAGRAYAAAGEFVTVDDCETVTRQLQYSLEVDGVAYERLEVSSPGLDRPLRTEAHFQRFAGAEVSLQLKEPFQGRKSYRGVLGHGDTGWTLVFDEGKGEQQLGFELAEVREARLVPVVNFKGRARANEAGGTVEGGAASGAAQDIGAAEGAAHDGGLDR